jgi:hypothetical protein
LCKTEERQKPKEEELDNDADIQLQKIHSTCLFFLFALLFHAIENKEQIDYPYPVLKLKLVLVDTSSQMVYMDAKPVSGGQSLWRRHAGKTPAGFMK